MYSYSKLTFHNSTHLTHAFMNSANNAVIDEITIVKTVRREPKVVEANHAALSVSGSRSHTLIIPACYSIQIAIEGLEGSFIGPGSAMKLYPTRLYCSRLKANQGSSIARLVD
jgi:hypothetical protein